ncbi:hypothetical protein CMUS01_02081 [Colletotrichum musicola]|uniref:Uncharacterized protein n=1 Tax=Colletotrichum musicola TaxID=2175873 RepID=A0A8H6NVM9_9PEZI|nr:hypothetical protein CMUS01_02081 [Colletotrichum musicola]
MAPGRSDGGCFDARPTQRPPVYTIIGRQVARARVPGHIQRDERTGIPSKPFSQTDGAPGGRRPRGKMDVSPPVQPSHLFHAWEGWGRRDDPNLHQTDAFCAHDDLDQRKPSHETAPAHPTQGHIHLAIPRTAKPSIAGSKGSIQMAGRTQSPQSAALKQYGARRGGLLVFETGKAGPPRGFSLWEEREAHSLLLPPGAS